MKRYISLLLCVGILLSAAGCSTGAGSGAGGDSVIDGSGAVLVAPENPGAIKIASVYAVAVPFITALGLTGQVSAINVKSKFWTDADSALAGAGTVGRGTVDMEALASFAPGVLIHRSNDPATVDAVAGKLGIPVLCITVENYEDINYTLVMMGKYFGREERAQQVCSWLSGKFEMISEIVDLIPPGERVRALMMGGELGRIAGGEMIQSWMIEKAGGICTASGIENNRNWANVGEETIFEWNPDVIFATSSTPLNYTVQALMRDPAWSAMAAIKNQAVYIVPAGIDSWDMPGISSALGTMYMLHCMYPSYFSAEQLQSEIDEYYMFMFGKTFSSEYLGYDLAN